MLRRNRTLRDVYTNANPNVSNRYFTLTPNRTLPDLYRNLAAIRLLAILFFITTGSSSSVRFRATAENRKRDVFLLDLSSHLHIFIAKNLFSSRDDWFEIRRETTALACLVIIIRLLSVAQKRFLFKVPYHSASRLKECRCCGP